MKLLRAALVAAAALVACHADLRFDDLGKCAADVDCGLSSLHCTGGQCVACTSDAHCTAPGRPRCDLALHRCIECGVTGDCTGGAVCKTGHCAPPCSAGCPAATPICDDGVCVQCDEGKGCAAGTLCLAHACVTCGDDSDCGGATPRCEPVVHQCVQCQGNADCPSDTPLCDLALGRCAALP